MTEYLDSDASNNPKVHEYHKVIVSGSRYDVNTQKTPYYVQTIDLDDENND